jgi:hypothetical protein
MRRGDIAFGRRNHEKPIPSSGAEILLAKIRKYDSLVPSLDEVRHCWKANGEEGSEESFLARGSR